MPISCYASFDEALEALAGYGIELKNGNSNHAPMVGEALCALGRPQAVMPWIAAYKERLLPRGPAGDPIPPTLGAAPAWATASGLRIGQNSLPKAAKAPWPDVLDRWTERLAPAFGAAATHGVIRVGHAVRSLAEAETPWRRRELGDALASWAATYQELPSSDRIADCPMRPRAAIARVPIIPPPRRRSLGNITASLAMLDDFPEFAPVIGLLDVGGDIKRLLAELTDVFARIYLANAHDVLTSIMFIHGVTSLTALGAIVPHVGERTAIAALRYGWQTACALYACFGANSMAAHTEQCAADAETLIDCALANGDEHVIKFTEACLRRNALGPSPAYCAAVEHALRIMHRR